MDGGAGCYLEVVENQRLVWTTALQPGFRPAPNVEGGLPFTAIIAMEPAGSGTKYTAIVMHDSAEANQRHASMGFTDGWGKALDQLVSLMKS